MVCQRNCTEFGRGHHCAAGFTETLGLFEVPKHVELLTYDEKLRHYADMRISLDLDDGVKVNYGKFGDLLDNVKSVTGGTEE
ncbi:hypothetical protein MASR1M60_11370 [Rhodocyclaceae bacterium]